MRNIIVSRHNHFEKVLVPAAVPWDEDKTKFEAELCVKGETYVVPALFPVLPLSLDSTFILPDRTVVSPCGRFIFVVKTLGRGQSLMIAQGARRGSVWFTTDVFVPVLAAVPNTTLPAQILMSLTPNEIISMRRGVRAARGKVMVGGLGLGWLLQKVCAKKSVKEVVLVEKDQGIVRWLLPVVKNQWPHVGGKLKDVIVGDAVDHVGKHGWDTKYLLDVWTEYGEAHHDERFQQSKKRAACVWGWGDNGGKD
jgi:hypothetical protein